MRSMRYNMSMMVIPIYGEANVFSNNEALWKIFRRPEVTLKKKHVSICFHAVCEAVTSWIMCVGFVKGKNNLAGCKKN